MKRLKLIPAILGLLTAISTVQAQGTVTVNLTAGHAPNAGSVAAFDVFMSPYTGTVDGMTERLNCVDFFHDVMVGQVWTATTVNLGQAISNLSLLGFTREGSNGLYTLAEALKIYQEAALLTTQYAANPASNPTQTTAIQTAIWAIANNQPNNAFTSLGDFVGTLSTSSTNPNTTGYWISYAQSFYNHQAPGFYDQFEIVTDVDKYKYSSVQEFVYSTPEPATLTLFGTGLMGLAGIGLRRRRNFVAAE